MTASPASSGPKPALVCAQTGSARSVGACLALRSGACAYCGLPARRDPAGAVSDPTGCSPVRPVGSGRTAGGRSGDSVDTRPSPAHHATAVPGLAVARRAGLAHPAPPATSDPVIPPHHLAGWVAGALVTWALLILAFYGLSRVLA